jgi:hypothetical protein
MYTIFMSTLFFFLLFFSYSYLSSTTVFSQTHISLLLLLLLLLLMMIINLSSQFSRMTVCTSVSLAITAHELSLSFSISSLDTYILINVGGIDIYYTYKKIFFFSKKRKEKHGNNEVKSQFPTSLYEETPIDMFNTDQCSIQIHLPVPCTDALEAIEEDIWCGTLSKRGRAISTSLEKCFKHVNAVFRSASHSIVCCLYIFFVSFFLFCKIKRKNKNK